MNRKKIILSLVAVVTFITFALMQLVTYAATLQPPKYFGITELRDNGIGYAIQDPNHGGTKIWNIVKYSSDQYSDPTDGNIYCLKAGVGAGFNSLDRRAAYNLGFDMKTEKTAIAAVNNTLASITQGNVSVESSTVDKYNSILALADLLYLKQYGSSDTTASTEAEKAELLRSAKIRYISDEEFQIVINYIKDNINISNITNAQREYVADKLLSGIEAERQGLAPDALDDEDIDEIITGIKAGQSDEVGFIKDIIDPLTSLTDEDIIAIQQAALWYYTNNENQKYDLYDGSGLWLELTTNGTDYDNIDMGKISDVQDLYDYLVKTAADNSDGLSTEAPAEVKTTNLSSEERNSKYILGPIKVEEKENNSTPYTIDFNVKNGSSEINYALLDSNKEETDQSVKDLVGQDFYISLDKTGISSISNISVGINIKYSDTKLTLYANGSSDEQPILVPEKINREIPVNLTPNKSFDLSLRKYIVKVQDRNENVIKSSSDFATRNPNIDTSTIYGETTTATYKHRKDPVVISEGDLVTYKLTIYNEGDQAGYATSVVDQLPTGLKFRSVVGGDYTADTEHYDYEGDNRIVLNKNSSAITRSLLPFDGNRLDSESIEILCEVTATTDENSKILTNVAWISSEYNAETGKTITDEEGLDRDSEPATTPNVNKDNMENYTGRDNKSDLTDSDYYYKGQQDDDDFEKLILLPESFDLKLVKRITEVNGQSVPERIKSIDVSKLNIDSSDAETTAEYDLNKDPVSVKKGDIVTYTLRVYNEGTIDGYASEITEDIPEGLKYLYSEATTDEEIDADTTLTDEEKAAIKFNRNYYWTYADETLKTIKTDYLSKERETTESNLISAFGRNDGTKTVDDLKYKEVPVKLEVVSEDTIGTIIRNEAAITEDTDKDGNEIDDRDSDTEEWVKYEDDEDFDNIILQSFDLSLRKFIIAVSNDETIEDSEYLKNEDGSYKRAPVVDTSKLNTTGEDGKMITTAIYNHTKEPVLVQRNNIVIYMLRVYNEGEIDGYASEIKDHLPPYLEFVEGEFNNKYGWEISEDGRTATTDYLKDSKIKAADVLSYTEEGDTSNKQRYKLSYKEVPIMCKVKETAVTNEKVTNIADITKYLDGNKKTVTDRDSQEDNVTLPDDKNLPGYKDDEKGDYIPGQQDDDDFEKVIVREFDLALRKWVTHAIVIENGAQTVTETGHQPYDDPEQVVKVELHRKKLNQVVVKFKYSIRVINEGDIEGYAKEVTDYIPQGLKFVAEDNPGWKDEGNNVISTRLLEDKLLKPGEYADIEVILTWINNENNMGVMTNTAEISEDYNEYGVPDRDSTPDNKKQGEDDIDDAPVMLSISTGQIRLYFTLGFIVLITVAGGVVLIKKYII